MELSELIRDAERIFVFTGAGISTGSGIKETRGFSRSPTQPPPPDAPAAEATPSGRPTTTTVRSPAR